MLHATKNAMLDSTVSLSADIFSTFFTNKILHICTNIVSITCNMSSLYVSPPLPSPGFSVFVPVSLGEASLFLLSLTKSSPVDIIPVSLLKSHSSLFSVLLMNLANCSFSTGVFPSLYKSAQITPLLKKSGLDPSDPSSYRPISNLRTLGKLLERLVQARLRSHLLSSPNFSQFQSAYRPHFSTETSALFMANTLFTSSSSGAPTLSASLDLSAAFDCVSHSILLSRLQNDFGLTGSAVSWIESYLCERSQSVSVNGSSSSPVILSLGVPQGSVLGPLFFTAYVSPIARLISSFGVLHHTYADDTTLFVSFDLPFSSVFLNDCTSALSSWFLFNGLQLNPSKSEVMWVGTRSQLQKADAFLGDIKIASVPIVPSSKIKMVGVTFDSKLTFNDHISEVCRTTNFHLRALGHIRKFLDVSTANTIACAIINSRLDYCNSVLTGMSQSNFHRLQRLQNRAAKLVLNCCNHRTPSEPLLRQLHWLPVVKRVDYKVALLTFKTLSCGQPHYLHTLCHPYSSGRDLRSSNTHLLSIPHSVSAFQSCAFSVYAPRLWNCLPTELRSLVVPSASDPITPLS